VSSSPLVSLSRLPIGAVAMVATVAAPAGDEDADLMLRLIEIGFLPGEPVRVIARGQPGDEPIAVRIGRSTFALRRFEAAFVQVELQAEPSARPAADPATVTRAAPADGGIDQRRGEVPAPGFAAPALPYAARP
jgi:ferrous iron transport protein A